MNTGRFVSSSTLTFLICLAIPFLLCVAAATPSRAAKQKAEATPFTLETQIRLYDASASSYRLSRQITARTADGTQATLAYDPTHEPHAAQAQMRVIVYPDGRRTEVYDPLRIVTRWPADPSGYAFQKDLMFAPPRDCVATSGQYLAGYTKLGGVKVAIVKEFPKGSSGMTWWRAPELGCETLQGALTQVQEDGSFRLVSETKFVSLKLGAPDAALFAVPSAYHNIKPSEALRAWAKGTGQGWNSDLQAQGEREDALYARLQRGSSSRPPRN